MILSDRHRSRMGFGFGDVTSNMACIYLIVFYWQLFPVDLWRVRTQNTCPLIPAVCLFAQEESARGISCRTVEVQYLLRQRNLSFTIPHKIIWRTKVPPIENKIIVSIVPKKNPAFPDPNFLFKDYQVNSEDFVLMIWNYPWLSLQSTIAG